MHPIFENKEKKKKKKKNNDLAVWPNHNTHFVPTHTIVTAEGAGRIFLHNVWKLHRLL